MADQLFISYSHEDRYCARLLSDKLGAADFVVWRDTDSLIPGRDWRSEIEVGIDTSRLVLLLMSRASCASSYVTFEWAFALGRGKIVVPVKLEDCTPHKRVDILQYSNLTDPADENFSLLIGRLRFILDDDETPNTVAPRVDNANDENDLTREEQNLQAAIMAYLHQGGYQAVSFGRVRERIQAGATDANLRNLVKKSPYFVETVLRDKRPGLRYIG